MPADAHGSHVYRATCRWSGSTGAGYDGYDRAHEGGSPPALARVALSADPAFRGDPARLNPEQLVVLAAASCQLLSFLAVAARARVDVIEYHDEAEGEMTGSPLSLTSIVLRPTIRVASAVTPDRVRHLVEVAHRECYIANSLRTTVRVEPTVSVDPTAASAQNTG